MLPKSVLEDLTFRESVYVRLKAIECLSDSFAKHILRPVVFDTI